MYPAKRDPFVDFTDDAPDFKNQSKLDKVFKITVSNNNAADQLVIINPSRKPSYPLRVIQDGNIPYASGATDLTASGSPNTIAELLAYIKDCPSRVLTVKVASNNSAQISNSLIITHRNVFAQPGSETINLDKYTDEYAPNDKLVTVKKEFQLDNDTELGIVIPAAMTVGSNPTITTFSFTFGGSLTLSGALANKRASATV